MKKISIITAVYNDEDHIEGCIRSVLEQTYPEIEYIVIDGASTDKTQDIIKKHSSRISKFISEKDNGFYDALNKGIKNATGDIVGVLHSDDIFYDKTVIESIANVFNSEEIDSVYGDLIYVKENDASKVVRYWEAGEYSQKKIIFGWMPPHPTFFVKKKIYEKYGLYDMQFKIAADYEMILRFLYKERISIHYLKKCLVKMRWGGMSNRNIYSILNKTYEDYKICKSYNLSWLTVMAKNFCKIGQFLKKIRY